MRRERKTSWRAGRRVWIGLIACALGTPLLGQLSVPTTTTPPATEPSQISGFGSSEPMESTSGTICGDNQECDDGQGCTNDMCSGGLCINTLIHDCVPCIGVYVCPPVDIVFIMDTSGSMRDEAVALCMGINQLVADLAGLGIVVNPHFLGITQAPGGSFSCLTDHVVNLLGPEVPGDAGSCAFPDTLSAYESWGPATAIVAERFPWTPDATRLIVPISDEGPCDGSRPEGCNDPGDDRDSVLNAIAVATTNSVIVSPIAGTGADACVLNLATAMANGSGGIAVQTKNPKLDFTDVITEIILDRCSLDERCNDRHVCTTNDRCIDTVCVGTPIDDCEPCLSPASCDDQDACTTDDCVGEMCIYTPIYDESTQCCVPTDGTITPIDDENPCTEDSCDPLTGLVTHSPAPGGGTCVDGDACTLGDRCDGEGHCDGTDAGDVECTSDADCAGLTCDLKVNRCVCGDIPEICLVAVPDPLLATSCFSAGNELLVDIQLGSTAQVIVGGQFLIGYDPAVLDFIDIEPGAFVDPESPFGFELMRTINEAEGTVFYAVGVPVGMSGTRGPALMARLRFQPLEGCTTDDLCFLSKNPQRTILTNDKGHQVPHTTCCTGDLLIQGDGPILTCPQSRSINANPGTLSATVTWDAPGATSECEGEVLVSCTGTNEYDVDVKYLVNGGGLVPGGRTDFHCTALDSCGAEAACDWTIQVHPTNTVKVDLQLAPVMAPGPVRRCIEFALYSSCFEEPVFIERTVEFGQPFNLPGRAFNVLLEVPAGQYECITARDPKHTLTSVTSLQISGDRYVAGFVGDPQAGGHWLIGGNLDGNQSIDALDEQIFYSQNGASVSPHTPCGTPGLHADINGDGVVNTTDLGFIQRSFLATDPPGCCEP